MEEFKLNFDERNAGLIKDSPIGKMMHNEMITINTCKKKLDEYLDEHEFDEKATVHYLLNSISESFNKSAFSSKVKIKEYKSIDELNNYLKDLYDKEGKSSYLNRCNDSFILYSKQQCWLIRFNMLMNPASIVIRYSGDIKGDITDFNRATVYEDKLDLIRRVMKEDVFNKYNSILSEEYIQWLADEVANM